MKNPNEMTVKRTKEKKRGKVDEKKTRESVRSLSKVKKVQILSPRQPPFKNVDELLQDLFLLPNKHLENNLNTSPFTQ